MCLSLSRPELIETLIVEDISPRISSSIGLIPNFIEAMKRVTLSTQDLTMSQVLMKYLTYIWTKKKLNRIHGDISGSPAV